MVERRRLDSLASVHYLVAITAVAVAAATVARLNGSDALAFSAIILGLYGLHLVSVRDLLRRDRDSTAHGRLAQTRGERDYATAGRSDSLGVRAGPEPSGEGEVPPPAQRSFEPRAWWRVELEREGS
ncbi:MAG: hypothetical protein ACE5JR_08030 [Gemmatimonadota bacterium]